MDARGLLKGLRDKLSPQGRAEFDRMRIVVNNTHRSMAKTLRYMASTCPDNISPQRALEMAAESVEATIDDMEAPDAQQH